MENESSAIASLSLGLGTRQEGYLAVVLSGRLAGFGLLLRLVLLQRLLPGL